MNEVIKQIKERKSVRVFTDKKIGDEEKRIILQSAIEAPTAGNQSMYSMIDVTDPELLKKLADSCDHQPFIADAKMAVIFCIDWQKWYDAFAIVNQDVRKPGVGDFLLGANDALIAAQNAVVAAESLGIGSCYIGDIMEQYEYHKELLQLPDYVFPITFIVFGYPSDQQKNRKKPARFTIEEMVSENTYHRKGEEELKTMFTRRGNELVPNFDYDQWMLAFANRKYESDFSAEMGRSVLAALQVFIKNTEENMEK